MIDCPNAEMRDRLPDLTNDSLSPDLRAIVVAHVAGCAECAAELEILRLARLVVLRGTPAVDVAAIVGALPRGNNVRSISTARSLSSWRIAAAVTVLAAGAGSFAVMQNRSSLAPRDISPITTMVTDTSAGLAMTGSLADLDESELQTLMDGLSKIDALPSTEVDGTIVGVSGTPGVVLPDSIVRDLEGN